MIRPVSNVKELSALAEPKAHIIINITGKNLMIDFMTSPCPIAKNRAED